MRRLGICSLLAAALVLVVAALWGRRAGPDRVPRAGETRSARQVPGTLPATIATETAQTKEEPAPTPAPDTDGFKVTGVVYGADDQPCAALVVALCTDEGSMDSRSVQTGADGKYVLPLPTGSWEIHAETEKKLSAAELTESKEGDYDEIDFFLDESAFVFGTVSSGDGRLLEGARVVCDEGYERPLSQTRTDASGTYRLVIPNWEVAVRYSAQGFATKSIRVEPEQEDEERRLDVQLTPGATLAGRVFDPDGQPHAAARVELGLASSVQIYDARQALREEGEVLGPEPGDQEEWELGPTVATTDENGEFSFEGLDAAWYVVTASAKERASGTSPSVALPPGETRRVEIRLGAGGTIAGIVVGSRDGAPIGGAKVCLDATKQTVFRAEGRPPVSESDPPGYQVEWMGAREVTTGADGRFQLEGVEPGTHRVVALVDGLSPALASVVAREGKRTEVELRVSNPGRIFGRVALPSGALVERCQVTATHVEMHDISATTVADAAGGYSIEGLGEGEYTVYASVTLKDRRVSPSRLESHRVRLEGGASLRVDIGMMPERTVTGVVRRNGKPIARQQVLFMLASGRASDRTTTTDDLGRYTATQLDAGDHYVWLGFQWGSMVPTLLRVPEAAGVTVLDIDVPGGRVFGRVTDGATGQGVGGARVVVSRPGAQSSGYAEFMDRMAGAIITTATGDYQVPNLSGGTYDVTVAYGNRVSVYGGRIQISEGTCDVQLDVLLAKGVSLTIHVQDAAGHPIPNASATVRVVETDLPLDFFNFGSFGDREGRLVIQGLLPGTYDVTAHVLAGGFASITREVSIGAGPPEPVRFVLPVESTVDVQVVDGRGAPVAGATVLMRHEGRGRVEVPFVYLDIDSGRGTTNEHGRSVRGRLAPGRYTIEVRLGERVAHGEVEVEEGQKKVVGVTLR